MISVCAQRMPWKWVPSSFVEQQRFTPAERVASALGNLAGLDEGQFVVGEFDARGRLHNVRGDLTEADYWDGSGKVTRPSNPERIAREWQRDPCSTIFYATPHGAAFLDLFDVPVDDLELRMDLKRARCKLLDAWLERHDLRPIEYAPGKFRGGFVVDVDHDASAPTFLPRARVNGELRSTTIYVAPEPNLCTPERLIARAASMKSPLPVEIPRPTDRRGGGILNTVANLIGIGGGR